MQSSKGQTNPSDDDSTLFEQEDTQSDIDSDQDERQSESANDDNILLNQSIIGVQEFDSLTITCPLPAHDGAIRFVWTKDGSKFADEGTRSMEDDRITMNVTKRVSYLTFNQFNESDVGDYSCYAYHTHLAHYKLRTKPRVMFNFTSFKQSETVEIYANWSLTCKFANFNYSRDAELFLVRCPVSNKIDCEYLSIQQLRNETQTWLANNTHRATLDVLVGEHNLTEYRLSVTKVTYRDSVLYMCVGVNFVFSKNNTLLLRVHDRVDSVWPIVALIALIGHLFAFVGIYENRRVKATNLIKLDVDVDQEI